MGYWEKMPDRPKSQKFRCSKCGRTCTCIKYEGHKTVCDYKYCPYCREPMESEGVGMIRETDAISRQAAIEALNCEIKGNIESYVDLTKYKREFQEFANMILNAQEKALRELPPVATTRKEITTCKECKYNSNGVCPNFRHFVEDNFYCAVGERRK